jgi:hypothetical protein
MMKVNGKNFLLTMPQYPVECASLVDEAGFYESLKTLMRAKISG